MWCKSRYSTYRFRTRPHPPPIRLSKLFLKCHNFPAKIRTSHESRKKNQGILVGMDGISVGTWLISISLRTACRRNQPTSLNSQNRGQPVQGSHATRATPFSFRDPSRRMHERQQQRPVHYNCRASYPQIVMAARIETAKCMYIPRI